MALVLGTNCGFVTTAPTTDPTGSEATAHARSNATMDTTSAGNKIVTEIGWWCGAASVEANFEVGIYTDSGGTIPDALLSVSRTNAKGTTEGWKRVTGLNISLNGSTAYWLAIQVDGTSAFVDYSTGGAGHSIKTTQTELPSPWGAENQGGTLALAIYAVYETAPTPPAPAVTTKKLSGSWATKKILYKPEKEQEPIPNALQVKAIDIRKSMDSTLRRLE